MTGLAVTLLGVIIYLAGSILMGLTEDNIMQRELFLIFFPSQELWEIRMGKFPIFTHYTLT